MGGGNGGGRGDDNLDTCRVIMTISQFRVLLGDLRRARETIIDLSDKEIDDKRG